MERSYRRLLVVEPLPSAACLASGDSDIDDADIDRATRALGAAAADGEAPQTDPTSHPRGRCLRSDPTRWRWKAIAALIRVRTPAVERGRRALCASALLPE